jgi:hypothetical protein
VTGHDVSFTSGALAFSGRATGDSIEGRASEPAAVTSLNWTSTRVR